MLTTTRNRLPLNRFLFLPLPAPLQGHGAPCWAVQRPRGTLEFKFALCTRVHTHTRTSTCRRHVYFAHTWGPAPHAACPHSSTCGLQVDLPLTPSLTHQPALCLQSGNHQSVARAAAPGRGRVTETWSSPGAWGRVGGRCSSASIPQPGSGQRRQPAAPPPRVQSRRPR